MTPVSALNYIHKPGLFGNHENKNEESLLKISEIKKLLIVQIVQYKNTTVSIKNLNIDSLVKRVEEGEIEEIIFALSPTLDGDTTSFYISKRLSKFNLRITTISRGIPIGGEIEYADEVTLGKSISSRINYNIEK